MTPRARAAGAARETFVSLRHRNFRLFFTGQLISQVGNWLTLVAQTLLVLDLTDSGVALGVLAAAQFGPMLVLGPWAGLVADRSDKRRLLLIVQVLAMVGRVDHDRVLQGARREQAGEELPDVPEQRVAIRVAIQRPVGSRPRKTLA